MKKIATWLTLTTLFCAPALADEVKGLTTSINDETVLSTIDLSSVDQNWYQGYAFKVTEDRDAFAVTKPAETDEFGLSWSGTGRWGLTLDVTRRAGTDILPSEEEVGAGAFFQVTPRLRLGGGIRFRGDDVTDTRSWLQDDEERETDVRIESAFSF